MKLDRRRGGGGSALLLGGGAAVVAVGAGCEPLACGPGTAEADGVCVVAAGVGGDLDVDALRGPRRAWPDGLAAGDGGAGAGDTAAVDTAADTGPEEPDVVEVYLLLGQSNMDGYAPATGLPPSLLVGQPDVPLYWSARGSFAPLAPSSRLGAAWTGPEVTFGRALADAGRDVALVKEATGGVSLAGWWKPGESRDDPDVGAGWAALMDTLDAATAELDAGGRPWRWAGVALLQGEADAWNADHAAAFEANLARFVRRVREETGVADLPFAIGELHCAVQCPWNDEVVAAQAAVAAADPRVAVVETGDLSGQPGDDKHLDGPSVRVLGERLAGVFLGAELVPAPVPALTVTAWGAEGAGGGGTVGWRFTTAAPLTVTDVGAFGEAAPGDARAWGLWDVGTATLLARGHVPGAAEAPTSGRGGFWYAAVEPIALPPGDYVLGLVAGDETAASAGGEVFGAGVTFVEGRAAEEAWLAYPGTAGAFVALGPGFLYTAE